MSNENFIKHQFMSAYLIRIDRDIDAHAFSLWMNRNDITIDWRKDAVHGRFTEFRVFINSTEAVNKVKKYLGI